MSAVRALLGVERRRDVWDGEIVDVDVHAAAPTTDQLWPYLSEVWRQHIGERGYKGPPDTDTYPADNPSSARPEWRPEDDRRAAQDVGLLREHLLDPWEIDVAIVNCVVALQVGHPDMAAAWARATNDWLLHEWLEVDERLRASLVLPMSNLEAAVEEVHRLGAHPQFVQALLPVRSGRPLGHRQYHPLYKALERNGLVAGIHWGGQNDGAPPTPSGWPSWFVEEYSGEIGLYMTQISSVLAEGVFQACPDLRMAVLEGGFAWYPTWGWRLDRDWHAMRREIPWLDRRPMEVVREHIRWSTAPLDAGPPEELARVIEWLGPEQLMFATDYPHSHDDELATLLGAMEPDACERLMSGTARDFYQL